jgi:hypothetical protein
MFTNDQPDMRAASQQCAKHLRQPNGSGWPVRFDRSEAPSRVIEDLDVRNPSEEQPEPFAGAEEFGRKQCLEKIADATPLVRSVKIARGICH